MDDGASKGEWREREYDVCGRTDKAAKELSRLLDDAVKRAIWDLLLYYWIRVEATWPVQSDTRTNTRPVPVK